MSSEDKTFPNPSVPAPGGAAIAKASVVPPEGSRGRIEQFNDSYQNQIDNYSLRGGLALRTVNSREGDPYVERKSGREIILLESVSDRRDMAAMAHAHRMEFSTHRTRTVLTVAMIAIAFVSTVIGVDQMLTGALWAAAIGFAGYWFKRKSRP